MAGTSPLSQSQATSPLRLVMADGSLEALKWVGVGLMALDHVNKYLLQESSAVLFELGRMVMPLFGFVLMYNLTRPDALSSGMHLRVMQRLLIAGALSTPVFVALVGWWPLNILFTLLLATCIVWLLECGEKHPKRRVALAVIAFVVLGTWVEFWWFGLLACLGAWGYCRRTSGLRLMLWGLALLPLWLVNGNFSALAAIPLVLAARAIDLPVTRHRWFFYGFYPAHLVSIWLVLQVQAGRG